MTVDLHPEQARKKFFEVFKDCYWNSKLEIDFTSTKDRTVIAKSKIDNGEALVILNDSVCFDLDKARNYSTECLEGLDNNLVIPAYLYQFYCDHALCPEGYQFYFNALPTYEWYENNHEMLKVYLSLTKDQLEQLEDNFYIFGQLNRFLDWAATLSKLPFNKKNAIRALLAVATRSWSSSGLVPWIDFFNHSVDGSLLTNNISISATHKYKAGQEVNTCYGFKDSLKLLSIYGYAPEKKTVALVRLNVSDYAIALDSDLKAYHSTTKDTPFLIDKQLENFEMILAHFRLVVLNKYDTIAVNKLSSEYRKGLNGNNELNSVKAFLFCVNKTRKDLQQIQDDIKKVFGSFENIPESWRVDFQGKFQILSLLNEKILKHWMGLLDGID